MAKTVDVAKLKRETQTNNANYNNAIRLMDEAEKSNDPQKIEEAKQNFDQVCKDYVYTIMRNFVDIDEKAPFDRDFYIDLMDKIHIEGKTVPDYIGISKDDYKGENGLAELVSSARELSETASTNVKSISGYRNYIAMNPIDIVDKTSGKTSRVQYNKVAEGVNMSLSDLAMYKEKQEEKRENKEKNAKVYDGTQVIDADFHIDIAKTSKDLYESLQILRMDGDVGVMNAAEDLMNAAALGENEKVYELVTNLKDKVENYQYRNSNISDKTYVREGEVIFKSLQTITKYQDQVNAERRLEGKEGVFEKYRPMTNYCSTQYNSLDSDKNITAVMSESNDEQFLMKLTNTTSPAKAIARLGNLYISSSRISSGSRPVGCIGVEGLKSISERLEIDGIDLNEEAEVNAAVKTAAETLRGAIADENNHVSIYSIHPKPVNQKKDPKTGERKALFENYSFKEVVNEEAMQEYRTITSGFVADRAKNYEKDFNDLLTDISYSSRGGKTKEFEALTKQTDVMKRMSSSVSAEDLRKNIDKLIETSKNYIIAKRGQKKFGADIDILDKETNDAMANKFRTTRGKKRYESALAIYKSMTELKEKVTREYRESIEKNYQKPEASKSADNSENREKVGTSIFNDISKDYGKTSMEAGAAKENQKRVSFGAKTK